MRDWVLNWHVLSLNLSQPITQPLSRRPQFQFLVTKNATRATLQMAIPSRTTWCARDILKVELTRARVTQAAHLPVPMRGFIISTVSPAGDSAVLTRISPESTLVWRIIQTGSVRFHMVSGNIDLIGIIMLRNHDGILAFYNAPWHWKIIEIHPQGSKKYPPCTSQYHGCFLSDDTIG